MLQSIRLSSNHGGSSKVVKEVCLDLAAHGHEVTLLCGAAADNEVAFELDPGVEVRPELPFRQSWQDTWLVPPADLARIVSSVATHAAAADRVVIFDSHLPYPDLLPADVPTIWSLRDFVYVQALQGSMAFRRDLLIAPSSYIRAAFCDAVEAWLPGAPDRVKVIHNGVDLETYRHLGQARSRRQFGIEDRPVLLFPHRPEEAKGFSMALELCRRLSAGPFPDAVLLITRGTDVTLMASVRDFYAEQEAKVVEMGIADSVRFLDWVPAVEMPELYAAANVTLCFGDIVEACSNSALESLACGTPVVAANIACYREFPDAITKVPVGDLDSAEAAILELLACPGRVHVDLTGYGQQQMLDGFREEIEAAQVKPALVPSAPRGEKARIPVWISDQGGAFYDEYRKCRLDDPALGQIWEDHGRRTFAIAELASAADVPRLQRAGALVQAA